MKSDTLQTNISAYQAIKLSLPGSLVQMCICHNYMSCQLNRYE